MDENGDKPEGKEGKPKNIFFRNSLIIFII